MVGLAPVLYHGESLAFDLFDRLHGVLGAPFNAAYPALYRHYNGYSEADTQKKAASLRGDLLNEIMLNQWHIIYRKKHQNISKMLLILEIRNIMCFMFELTY